MPDTPHSSKSKGICWPAVAFLLIIFLIFFVTLTYTTLRDGKLRQSQIEETACHAEFLYAHATYLDSVDWSKKSQFEVEMQLLEKAETFEECLSVITTSALRHSPGDMTDIHWRAFSKALDQVTTTEEAYRIFSATTEHRLRKIALAKMEELACTDADQKFYEFVRQGHAELFYEDAPQTPAAQQTNFETPIPATLP
ncbi:hypothetical protein ACFL1U_01880 [Patescibacteria group bacterium]